MPPEQQAPAPIKKDWKTFVAASGGRAIFLPEAFRPKADAIEKLRADFNEMIKGVAKAEIALNMATQTMFYELRTFLSENGRDDVWTKEVGFDGHALSDGEYVVNLRDQQR